MTPEAACTKAKWRCHDGNDKTFRAAPREKLNSEHIRSRCAADKGVKPETAHQCDYPDQRTAIQGENENRGARICP